MLVCVYIGGSKSDVGYGVNPDLPYDLNENVASCLQYDPPLKYLLLWSDAALVNKVFAAYTVEGGGWSREVQ